VQPLITNILDLKELFKIQVLLFTKTELAWKMIREKEFAWQPLLSYYLTPLVFISAIMLVIFNAKQFIDFGFTPNQLFFITLGGTIAAVFLSAYLISKMVPRFAGIEHFDRTLALISFAYSPVFLVSLVSSLHPVLQILNFIAIGYLLYLFLRGTGPMLEIPPHKQMGFTIISLILIFGVRLIITVVLATILVGIRV